MKLVTGGAFQGKEAWAEKTWAEEIQRTADGSCTGKTAAGEKGGCTGKGIIARGSRDSYEMALEAKLVIGFQDYVRRMAEEGKSEEEILAFAGSVAEQNPAVIITMDEIGCGIVPLDPLMRVCREYTGRVGQLLAARAKEVYRITAGIPQRIK